MNALNDTFAPIFSASGIGALFTLPGVAFKAVDLFTQADQNKKKLQTLRQYTDDAASNLTSYKTTGFSNNYFKDKSVTLNSANSLIAKNMHKYWMPPLPGNLLDPYAWYEYGKAQAQVNKNNSHRDEFRKQHLGEQITINLNDVDKVVDEAKQLKNGYQNNASNKTAISDWMNWAAQLAVKAENKEIDKKNQNMYNDLMSELNTFTNAVKDNNKKAQTIQANQMGMLKL